MKVQYFYADHGEVTTCGWVCYRNNAQRARMMLYRFGADVTVSYDPVYIADDPLHHEYDGFAHKMLEAGVASIEVVASTGEEE